MSDFLSLLVIFKKLLKTQRKLSKQIKKGGKTGSMTIVQWDNCTVRQLYSRQLYTGQLYSIKSFFKKI